MSCNGELYSVVVTYTQLLEEVPQNVDLPVALLQLGSQIGALLWYPDLVCLPATFNCVLGYIST